MLTVHGPLRVWNVPTGPLQQNASVLADAAGDAYLFDPGDDAPVLSRLLAREGLRVRGILLTHAHFDHIGAVQALREHTGAPVWLHPAALPIYRRGEQTARMYGLPFAQPADPDHELAAGDTFALQGATLTVRDLPGHAPGHVVFVSDTAPPFVIAGDTVFAGSIGRTDLPGGDHATLLAGIRRELLGLPPETALYPGHGPSTTVGTEARSNPFLR